ALGPARAADPAREAASAAIFELARAAQAAGGSAPTSSPSIPAEPGSPATAGTPSIATAGTSSIATAPGNPGTASTPPGAVTPGAATPADPSTPGTPPVTMPLPVSAVQPAVVTLPGTAAAVARTAGAAKAIDTAGTGAAKAAEVSTPSGSGVADGGLRTENLPATHAPNHRPARGPVSRTSAAEPAAVAAPATPGSGLVIDTASGATQAGIPTAQAGIAQPAIPAAQLAGGGQPVAAGPGSEQVHRYPATDLPLASQVAGPVLSLRARGDGSHQLIVALHPAELGPVNVHVRIEGDLMTIQLASTSETAHDTLRDALPQLRSELQAAGLSTASLSLDLSSGGPGGFAGSGAFADPRQAAGAPNQAARLVPAGDQNPVPPRHRTSGDRVGTQSSSGLDRWL
ncbi:MAG TPA: flagellar hook-length control protein FliK, partial [Jatrophihabitans sp.]|nr:flagellar hook-length control protein FliK [Jatrophihabitans sp.]